MDNSDKEQQTLFICLGNIGPEYSITRHNCGFLFGEAYIEILTASGETPIIHNEKEYRSVAFRTAGKVFIFPNTLMNLSGRAVERFLTYHKFNYKLILVHDDLDLPLGEFKLSHAKGPRSHNGVTSVEQAVGHKDFLRVRIGIENRGELPISGLDYVLYKFTPEELKQVQETFPKIIAELELNKLI